MLDNLSLFPGQVPHFQTKHSTKNEDPRDILENKGDAKLGDLNGNMPIFKILHNLGCNLQEIDTFQRAGTEEGIHQWYGSVQYKKMPPSKAGFWFRTSKEWLTIF